MDYYQVLGVSSGASDKDIKQSYRRLARKYHPDVNPSDKSAEAKFKEANEAYQVLSDPEKRKKYDQFGANWKYADRFAQAGAQSGPSGFRGETIYDMGDFAAGSGDIFETLLGGMGGRTSRRPRRGQDVEYPVEVTLEEAYHGSQRIIQIQGEQVCSVCGGRGTIANAPCYSCGGTGKVTAPRRLEVRIPPGVDTGSRIRVAGEGGPGMAGGPKGDLYLVITVRPHTALERKGNDLHVEVPVSLTGAMLGGEIEVPTLKGKVMLRVPPETQNGRVFRLAGQGMPQLNGSAHGDLFAKVKVVLPSGLTERERELFKQLQAIRGPGRREV